jgi:predicted nucleic acid-binding protein
LGRARLARWTVTRSVNGEPFTIDTTILVYSLDTSAGIKHALAAEIVDRALEWDCRLTLQALSEFYAAVTCKGIVPTAEAARVLSRGWLELRVA